MIRGIGAVIAGLVGWGIAATALDYLLRLMIPGYAAAEPQLHFTLGMMIARLALPGALPSILAGFLGGWIGRANRWVTAVITIVLLGAFLPTHYRLWALFPAWYHATFIASLLFLPWFGARLSEMRKVRGSASVSEAAPGR